MCCCLCCLVLLAASVCCVPLQRVGCCCGSLLACVSECYLSLHVNSLYYAHLSLTQLYSNLSRHSWNKQLCTHSAVHSSLSNAVAATAIPQCCATRVHQHCGDPAQPPTACCPAASLNHSTSNSSACTVHSRHCNAGTAGRRCHEGPTQHTPCCHAAPHTIRTHAPGIALSTFF